MLACQVTHKRMIDQTKSKLITALNVKSHRAHRFSNVIVLPKGRGLPLSDVTFTRMFHRAEKPTEEEGS